VWTGLASAEHGRLGGLHRNNLHVCVLGTKKLYVCVCSYVSMCACVCEYVRVYVSMCVQCACT
jgi:hypothetical protein